jgi:hypothetical protein
MFPSTSFHHIICDSMPSLQKFPCLFALMDTVETRRETLLGLDQDLSNSLKQRRPSRLTKQPRTLNRPDYIQLWSKKQAEVLHSSARISSSTYGNADMPTNYLINPLCASAKVYLAQIKLAHIGGISCIVKSYHKNVYSLLLDFQDLCSRWHRLVLYTLVSSLMTEVACNAARFASFIRVCKLVNITGSSSS